MKTELSPLKVEKLKNVANIDMGQSPPSSTYNDKKIGLPFFQGKAEFGKKYPQATKYCSKPIRLAKGNDILMSVRAPVGPVNLSPSECCIGRGLCTIRARSEVLEQSYLFFYLRSIEKRIASLGQGSTFGAIGKQDIEEIKVPYPTNKNSQKQIVTILEKAEKLKEMRSEADVLTIDFLNAIFLEMFGNKGGKGWRMDVLSSICEQVIDIEHKMPKSTDSGIPFISAKDLADEDIDFSQVKYISKEDHEKLSKRCRPEKGDILYSRIGVKLGIARVVNVSKEFNISYSLCLIKVNKKIIDPVYLTYFLNSQFGKIQAKSGTHGIAVPDLGIKAIKNFKILVPPMKMQENFSSIVKRIDESRSNQKLTNENLNNLYDNLVQKAFKGELTC